MLTFHIFNFIKYVRENSINILHVHNLIGHTMRTRIIPKIAGIPIILEHEGGMVWDLNFALPTKLTNKLVTMNICNSAAGQMMLKEKCNINASIINNGVQFIAQDIGFDRNSILMELEINPQNQIIGFVGRLDTPKGVQAFVDLVPKINKILPHTTFLIVGDGPMKDELISYAKQYPECQQFLKWLGFRQDIRRIMHAFDALVMPSIREPFPNVLLEAAMARIPIVASNVDGIPEILGNGKAGILINCTDCLIRPISHKAKPIPRIVVDGETRTLRPPLLPNRDDMAAGVIQILQNPQISKTMGEQAFESVSTRFSFDKYIDNMNKVYTRCINYL